MAKKKSKPPSKKPREPNPQQERFVAEYLVDLNATQAAIRAGYSEKTAEVIGWQLLRKPLVAAKVSLELAKRQHRVEVKADRVLRELCHVAFSNIDQIFEFDGKTKAIVLKDPKKIPEEARRAISSMEVRQLPGGQMVKVKLWSKDGALRDLMRHLGMLLDKVAPTDPTGTKEYSGGVTDEQRLERILALFNARRNSVAGAASEVEPADREAPVEGVHQPGG